MTFTYAENGPGGGDPPSTPRRGASSANTSVLSGCQVVTLNPRRDRYASGYISVDGTQITEVGPGPVPERLAGAPQIDATGCLATPGLVNTHHHLYQWATRGRAVDATLFGWLTELYPVWARIDEQIVRAAATAALTWLARSGCTTTMDHHYVFPRDGGDVLGTTVESAAEVGLRFHPTRGSMDLGESAGGLPPDKVVEQIDTIIGATQAAIERFHDPSPGSMLRIGVAPCSPFSVTRDLLTESAALARSSRVRLHTHLAETADEDDYCAEHFGCTPAEYLDSLGWLGGDVWLAHCVHLDDAGSPGSPPPAPASPTAPIATPGSARASAGPARCWTPACRSGSGWTVPPPTRPALCSARSAPRPGSLARSAARRR